MIPVRSDRNAPQILGNQGETTKFTIEANETAYRILSSSLYSDKPRAIVRELSTNADDANNDAGRGDVPIKVHIPSTFNPTFTVSDTGTGMSRQTLTTVFRSYFSSTKRKSEKANGTMGLGSKSPLSYTDSMLVTSVCDGEKTVASVYLDQDGIPNINIVYHSLDVDEPNGTTISLGVEEGDVFRFQRAAIEVYTYFDVMPEIEGMSTTDLEESRARVQECLENAIETDVCLLPKILSIGEHNTPQPVGYVSEYHSRNIIKGVKVCPSSGNIKNVVVMSNVAYPIKREYINYSSAWTNGVVIFVPNGAVGFTPSREELDYTHRTMSLISQACVQFAREYNAKVIQKVNEKLDELTELRQVDELYHMVPYFKNNMSGFQSKVIPHIDKTGKGYTRISKLYKEFYWDHVELFHLLSNARTEISHFTGRKFEKSGPRGFNESYSHLLSLCNDLVCPIYKIGYYSRFDHSEFYVLISGQRFNKKNFCETLCKKKKIYTYVNFITDIEVFEAYRKFYTKWFDKDPDDFMVLDEVFKSGYITKNEIKAVKEESSGRVPNHIKHSLNRIFNHDDTEKTTPMIISRDSILLLDDDFTISPGKTVLYNGVDKDYIHTILQYSDYKIFEFSNITEYRKFRKSKHWDNEKNFGFVSNSAAIQNGFNNYIKYIKDNRQMILRSMVFKRYRESVGYSYKDYVPRMKKYENFVIKISKMCNVAQILKYDDVYDYISKLLSEADIAVDEMKSNNMGKQMRRIRKQIANDIDNVIKDLDNLKSEYARKNESIEQNEEEVVLHDVE